MNDRIAADQHVRLNVHALGIDHGHAAQHMAAVDARAHEALGLGQLHAVVHAHALLRLERGHAAHDFAVFGQQRNHAGEVIIAVVVRLQHLERAQELLHVERVHRAADLGQPQLIGLQVLLINHGAHRAALANHARRAEGIVHARGQHRRGARSALDLADQPRQRLALNERLVARNDKRDALPALKAARGALHRPARAEAVRRLTDELRAALVMRGKPLVRRAHDDDLLAADGVNRAHDVLHHRDAAHLMQHFRRLRAHADALSGSHHHSQSVHA